MGKGVRFYRSKRSYRRHTELPRQFVRLFTSGQAAIKTRPDEPGIRRPEQDLRRYRWKPPTNTPSRIRTMHFVSRTKCALLRSATWRASPIIDEHQLDPYRAHHVWRWSAASTQRMDTHQISMETTHKRAIQAPDDALRQPDKRSRAKEKPPPFPVRVDQDKAPGGDLLLHGRATLPSAHARFTSEFGMGSGGTTPLWPPGKGWEQRVGAGSTSS